MRTERVLLAAALLMAACAGGEGGSREFEVDSVGGVAIARNGPAESGDTLAALLSIGREAGVQAAAADEFGRVTAVALDRHYDIYVADGQSLEVRVFSRDGQHLRSFGRAGQGPGEFRALYSIAFLGDTLLTLDPRNARIALFTTAGRPLGTWPWLPLTGPSSYIRFYPVGEHQAWVFGLPTDGSRNLVHLRLRPDGPRDTVRHPPRPWSRTILVCNRADGGTQYLEVPFSGRYIASPSPTGLLASAWSADYRIAFTTPAGDTTRIIEREYSPTAISDAAWDSANFEFRQLQRDWPGTKCEPSAPGRPRARAALAGIYFDDEGRLVVEVNANPLIRYDFYNDAGRAVESVYLPMRDRDVAPAFRGRYILQVARDSLDVQYVQLFRR